MRAQFLNYRILNRYILSEILPDFLVSITVFTAIMLMARALQLTNLVIAKGVKLSTVLEFFALAAPRILAMTIPMAALLAVLMAFLRFSADSELTIWRASGLSLYQMAPPVLLFGVVITLLTALFSLWLAPMANWRFKVKLLDLAKTRADLAIMEQTFVRSFPGLILYIGQLAPGSDVMGQIFIEDSRNENEKAAIVAQKGRLSLNRETGTLLFHLENGVIDRIHTNRDSTDSIFFDFYELKFSPGEELERGNGLLLGRMELPTSELKNAAALLPTPTQSVIYYIEWHNRWSIPVTAFLMTMIGLPLGASFRAKSRNFALLMGLFIFISYYVLSSLGWSLAKTGLISPLSGLWSINILLVGLNLFLLRRINTGLPIDLRAFIGRLLASSNQSRPTHGIKL